MLRKYRRQFLSLLSDKLSTGLLYSNCKTKANTHRVKRAWSCQITAHSQMDRTPPGSKLLDIVPSYGDAALQPVLPSFLHLALKSTDFPRRVPCQPTPCPWIRPKCSLWLFSQMRVVRAAEYGNRSQLHGATLRTAWRRLVSARNYC